MNQLNKKDIFSNFRDYVFSYDSSPGSTKQIKISSLKDVNGNFTSLDTIIDEIKTLKVIELDNLESFISYINYDHYLIFKYNNDYYFCDTELAKFFKEDCLIKLVDYNQYFRKEKLINIEKNL